MERTVFQRISYKVWLQATNSVKKTIYKIDMFFCNEFVTVEQ